MAAGGEHRVGNWYSVPELRLRDHFFTVPLDHSSKDYRQTITVFAREAVAVGKEELSLPYLLYLQGGPGFESPRPTEASGWLKKASEDYRIVLLDQRGTGLSTPLTTSSLSQLGSAEKQAEYLKHFRADSIVNDAEFIRIHLVPDGDPWTVLGQSFGGFCAVTYLSFAPQGLSCALLTGGLPPIGSNCTADMVYKSCFEQIIHQNEKYYERFPQDIPVIQEVVKYLNEAGGVPLPSGGLLTARGLQILGLVGLGSGSGFERLHYLFERVWDPILVAGASKQISYYFLKSFESWIAFDSNPLYALLHESIFCQGASSKWSAHRMRNELPTKFDPVNALEEGHPVYFTGEGKAPSRFEGTLRCEGGCGVGLGSPRGDQVLLATVATMAVVSVARRRCGVDGVWHQCWRLRGPITTRMRRTASGSITGGRTLVSAAVPAQSVAVKVAS